MKISFVEIKNYRKLKSCRIDFSDKKTVFVGSNNSGKTSAMFALKNFLKDRKLNLNDITISNLTTINALGAKYLTQTDELISVKEWQDILPSVDVWLEVKEHEFHYVSQIIPSLDWSGGLLGIRLIYEPKDATKLGEDYRMLYTKANEHKKSEKLKLWPINMCDFLKIEMSNCFQMNAYILDPEKIAPTAADETAEIQALSESSSPLTFDPFKGLIKVNFTPAQKGLEDYNDIDSNEKKGTTNLLSEQLRRYYDRQLDPEKEPSDSDIKALVELQSAKDTFNKQIKTKFDSAMKELSKFGYPGNSNPKITIESRAETSSIISHNTVVRYPIFDDGIEEFKLPEQYNGLGYQNLISMSFKLMNFRDSWINGEKPQKSQLPSEREAIQPIHLVLLEEPEAHLHVQVQQVFIKNAYDLLQNHKLLKGKDSQYTTQLILSTHSSNVALESDFEDLRYFKRIQSSGLATSVVSNLNDVFGVDDKTTRFVKRYLKATHCDLFFADAVIMVEGAGERILLPHFIKKCANALNQSYISILEINGRHAHTLKSLIEKLGLTCLVITDLDIVSNTGCNPSEEYDESKNQITTNTSITDWVINLKDINTLLHLPFSKKVTPIGEKNSFVRIAYQKPVEVSFKDDSTHTFVPYTFEDALAYDNFKYFSNSKALGGIKKIRNIFKKENELEIQHEIYELLRDSNKFKKAEFALELLMSKDPQDLKVPEYIAEALQDLESHLTENRISDFINLEEK